MMEREREIIATTIRAIMQAGIIMNTSTKTMNTRTTRGTEGEHDYDDWRHL